jgi:hypothetical protein
MILKSIIEPLQPDVEFEIIDREECFLPGCPSRMRNAPEFRGFFEPYLDRAVRCVTSIAGDFVKPVTVIEVLDAGGAEVEVKYEELTW